MEEQAERTSDLAEPTWPPKDRKSSQLDRGMRSQEKQYNLSDCKKDISLKFKSVKMRGLTLKETDIIKAENYNREILEDTNFSVLNVHGASTAGDAFLVITNLLLCCFRYTVACYKNYAKRMRLKAITSLDILKSSCQA